MHACSSDSELIMWHYRPHHSSSPNLSTH